VVRRFRRFGTKLRADLGAEVIKVESPEGDLARRREPFPQNQADQEKSRLFIYLNTINAVSSRTCEPTKAFPSMSNKDSGGSSARCSKHQFA
jgi:hypothetical protein